MSAVAELLALLDDAAANLRDPALIIVPPAFWKNLNDELLPATKRDGLQPGLAQHGFHACEFYGVPITVNAYATKPFTVSQEELQKGAAARGVLK